MPVSLHSPLLFLLHLQGLAANQWDGLSDSPSHARTLPGSDGRPSEARSQGPGRGEWHGLLDGMHGADDRE
jgi:hypothetical protein